MLAWTGKKEGKNVCFNIDILVAFNFYVFSFYQMLLSNGYLDLMAFSLLNLYFLIL